MQLLDALDTQSSTRTLKQNTSIALAYHTQRIKFSRSSNQSNFIMKLCHITATREQVCQMSKSNMPNQMSVIIIRNVLDI